MDFIRCFFFLSFLGRNRILNALRNAFTYEVSQSQYDLEIRYNYAKYLSYPMFATDSNNIDNAFPKRTNHRESHRRAVYQSFIARNSAVIRFCSIYRYFIHLQFYSSFHFYAYFWRNYIARK